MYNSGIIPHQDNGNHCGGCRNRIKERKPRNGPAKELEKLLPRSSAAIPEAPFRSTHSISMFSSSTKALKVPTSSSRKMLYLIHACTSASEPHSPKVPAMTPSLCPITAGIPRPSRPATAFSRGE